ncbi:MAG: ABC transporter ATP-binding protein, partial [Pseudomonadota bacterium]
KGMLQRIGVAQALINDPELVILDEPLTGLDPLGRKQLRDLIADLRRKNKTVVISSHILSDVELLADRVAILVKGKTVDTGPLCELLDTRTMSIEIVVKHFSSELVAILGKTNCTTQKSGDTLQILIEDETLADSIIDVIRENQGSIVSVIPRKESLEDVVVRRATAGAK